MCDSDSGLSLSMNGSQNDTPCQSVIFIRLTCPELELESIHNFSPTDIIMDVKMNIINSIEKPLKDKWNYGLFLPPSKGKAGKFLQEDRMLKEYPFDNSVGHLELKYKQRVYRVLKTNVNKLKKIHIKSNLKHFLDCVKSGDVDKVSKWLNKGLDPNFQWKDGGETPLTIAVKLEKPREMIMALVAGGAHLDYRDADTMTPLHRAAALGNYEAIKVLLDLGQSPNTRDQFELTPLYYAVLNDTVALCVERLLYDHSELGKSDEAGLQEIHQACRFGRVQHLETLLAYGADINSQTAKNGNTPLHICAFTGQESCARLLLFRGADRTLLNRAGHTAYQQAVLVENNAVADLIRTFQSKDVVPLRVNPERNERRRSFSRIRSQQRCSSLGRLSDFDGISHSRATDDDYAVRRATGTVNASNAVDYEDYRMTSSVSGFCLDSMLLEDEHCGMRDKSAYGNRATARVGQIQNEQHPQQQRQPVQQQQNQTRSGIALSRSTYSLRNEAEKPYSSTHHSAYDADHSATMRVSKTGSFKLQASNGLKSTSRVTINQMSRPALDPNWMMPNSHQPENGSDTASIFSTNSSIRGLHSSNSYNSPSSPLQMLINGQGSILDLDTTNLPRVVVLQKGPRGFGFVVRGRRGVPGEFQPTFEVPALQYLEKVEPGSAADRAGLKSGDFILEVNGTNVSTMSHESVVQLIRSSGETLGMKVITVPVALNQSMTSLDQNQSMVTVGQSDSHSHLRQLGNDLSEVADNASLHSASTNGTMRSGTLGPRNRVRIVHDSSNVTARSNENNLSGADRDSCFSTRLPLSSKFSNSFTPPPPPPPPKSSGLSSTQMTIPVTHPPPPPTSVLAIPPLPPQLSSMPPANPGAPPPPPPPPPLPSMASKKGSNDCATGTLSRKAKSGITVNHQEQIRSSSSFKPTLDSSSSLPTSSQSSKVPPPPPMPSSLSKSPKSSIPPPPPPPSSTPSFPTGSSSASSNTITVRKPLADGIKKPTDGFEEDELPLPPPPEADNSQHSPQSGGACPLMQSLLNRVNNAEMNACGNFSDHLREAVERRRRKIEMNFSEDDLDDDDTSRSTFGKPRAQSTFYSAVSKPPLGISSQSGPTIEESSPNRTANRTLSSSGVHEENSFRAAAEKFHAKALARTIGLTNTIPPPDNFKDSASPQSLPLKPPVAPAKPPLLSNAGSPLGRINGTSKVFFANGTSESSASVANKTNGCPSITNLRANFERLNSQSSNGSSSIPPPPPIFSRSSSNFKNGL